MNEVDNGEVQSLTTRRDGELAAPNLRRIEEPANIMAILAQAVDRGLSADSMERLAALAERISDRQAAQDFASAMFRFQHACPSIKKTSTASFPTKNGGQMTYTYAELDAIAGVVRPLLAAEGLSYSWNCEDAANKLVCTCIVKHVGGHKESATFSCVVEGSDKMSGAQRAAAALTYARRQSLVMALGLTTTDSDTDAAKGVGAETKITEHQQANIEALGAEIDVNRDGFLRYFRIESIADLPASRFAEAIQMLEAKRKEAKR